MFSLPATLHERSWQELQLGHGQRKRSPIKVTTNLATLSERQWHRGHPGDRVWQAQQDNTHDTPPATNATQIYIKLVTVNSDVELFVYLAVNRVERTLPWPTPHTFTK